MVLFDVATKAFRALPNIGVTPDLRPEEAKHIQYLNIGIFLLAVINLAYFFQSITDARTSIIVPLAQLSGSILCVLVYIFNKLGRFTTARVYGFSLFYANALFLFPLSGKEIVDHYMIFILIGYAVLVFPRKEKGLMTAIIVLGVICYVTVLILYDHVPPLVQGDYNAVKLLNQVHFYVIMLIFVVLIISGRHLTDQMEDRLMEEREKLSDMAAVLKKMFGRYLSAEVMNSLLEDPSTLELGGEKRSVTIMMTDLRGFTAQSERLEPERVVQMLNAYFEVMMDVILKYNGTINEIIGDGLLVIFGAPQEMPNRAQQAIACAIEMQNAMAAVNERNRAQGLPDLEMGIGLNETEVIVGNIGSTKRSKYAVVGSGVNMTSRIESYTVGGQILISESVFKEAGEILRTDSQRHVLPKGAKSPLRIYEVGGISGQYNLALDARDPDFVAMSGKISLRYTVLEGKDVGIKGFDGFLLRLSENGAEIDLGGMLKPMTNLKMNLENVSGKLSLRDFYGKVVQGSEGDCYTHLVRFTSLPPEVDAYFQALRKYAGKSAAN